MEEIYLDNAATTRVDNSVAKKVKEVFLESYGNASSLHTKGREAKKKMESSKKKIATHLNCDLKEIIFTSGGTESNNLAIRGLAKANPEKKHIITSVIEHPCILETCQDLKQEGYEIDYIKIDSDGLVKADDISKKIKDNTLLVSIMHVNNEIGTIQPIEKISQICKERNIYFHTDNVQGFLKKELLITSIDMMSISGHKFCAPKGVGFLYVKEGVKILPINTGGGQENGLRSGTENIPGIVGLATALDIDFKIKEVKNSRDKIIEGLKKIKGAKINGSIKNRIYSNINVSFYGIEGESLMLMLDEQGIYVSTGSACASTKLNESHVLKALNVDEMYIHGSLRLSLGTDAIGKENFIVKKISEAVKKLREMSPFKLNLEEENGKEKDN
jgi:cysteine desulfurase